MADQPTVPPAGQEPPGAGAPGRPVLVPLDGSPLAERALPWAADLALRWGAPLLLLRVLHPYAAPEPVTDLSASSADYEAVQPRELTTAEDYLAARAGALKKAYPALHLRAHTCLGDAAAQILDVEQSEGVQLVVLTTHGRTGVDRLIRGSVAEKIVRHGAVPVLLVRPWDNQVPEMAETGRRVLVPLDGSDLAAQILPLARKLTRRGGEVILTTVTPVADRDRTLPAARRHLEELAAQVNGMDVTVRPVTLASDDPATAILDLAVMQSTDVIAMSTHGRGAVGRWLYGSVADRVAHCSRVPVLLFRPQVAGTDHSRPGRGREELAQ